MSGARVGAGAGASWFVACLLAFSAPQSIAAVTLANFESGTLANWTVTGGWTVGGTTGTSPNILPIEGAFFARSGAPNGSGALGESLTGTVTSPAFQVLYDTLTWKSTGWSGFNYDGVSKFQILDGNFNVKASIQTAQSDTWTTASTNLLSDGLTAGATFYFRAIDAKTNSPAVGYSWLAFDNLQLTGTLLPVPEPETYAMLLAGLALLGLAASRKT
jgi:hypothetical protein